MNGCVQMKKTFRIIIAIIIALAIVLDIFLFVSGSLEMFPTAEQIEKGRIVCGLFLVVFAIIETFVLIKIFKKK